MQLQPAPRFRGGDVSCSAYNGKQPDVGDRVIASIPFLLPMMDILPYGAPAVRRWAHRVRNCAVCPER